MKRNQSRELMRFIAWVGKQKTFWRVRVTSLTPDLNAIGIFIVTSAGIVPRRHLTKTIYLTHCTRVNCDVTDKSTRNN